MPHHRDMVRYALILLCVASGDIADAFRLPSTSRSIATSVASKRGQRRTASSLMTKKQRGDSSFGLSISQTDGDAELAEEIKTMDNDLDREIDAALALALDALAAPEDDVSPDEEDIDAIANMLLEKPPMELTPLPLPPVEPPPLPVISLGLEMGGDDGSEQPLPPDSPPSVAALTFAEAMQKKVAEVAEEIERLKASIFGIQEELVEIEASTAREEDMAAVIKKEIEDSIKEREEMVQRIELEFAAEKALLVAQMETASAELKVVKDEAAKNITDAESQSTEKERELMSRIDSVKAAIDKVTTEAIEINLDREKIERSKQKMLEKVVQESKNKLAQLKKLFDVDVDYAKKINADLSHRAEEAERKVRDAFDQISLIRSERVSLQQQIVDAENNALEEIMSLQREQELDDERYAAILQKERDRLDKVIDVAYQGYAERICEKIKRRQAIEADYREKLRPINTKIIAAKAKQEARVKEYLDKLEEKHKKERIEIYQEKFKGVNAIRERMNAELAIEYAKIEETKNTMQVKIGAVHEQTAQIKADFEREMAKKRQLAKEEEEAIFLQIEDVRLDMTDKLKTQRRLYEEKKAAYLEEMNIKISDSEVNVRQAWKELAGIKASFNDVNMKREDVQHEVAETQALIDAYESDRLSFRKSLRLTLKAAKEKIGSKTRNLLRRNNE